MFSHNMLSTRSYVRCILLALMLFLPFSHSYGESIYDYVPEDAYGFVSFNRLGELDEKLQRFTQLFQIPMPAPLTFLKLTTGLEEGLDKTGYALLAVLPTESAEKPVEPMLLMPVDDYSKFVSSINGDASEKICRVTIAGQDVLLAQKDSYALLMDLSAQEIMEKILSNSTSEVASLKITTAWLVENDLSIAIMPKGVEFLTTKGSAALSEQRQRMEEQFGNSPSLQNIGMTFDIYQWILDFLDKEIETAAWGLRFDQDFNLFIGKRVLVKEGGTLVEASKTRLPDIDIFKGFKDESFVVAGGGPMPESWSNSMTSLSVKMMKSMKSIYGLEDIPEEDWQKLANSYESMTTGMEGVSLVMLSGKEKQPLFSNLFGVMHTSDSGKTMKQFKSAIQDYNGVMSQSKTFKMKYEISDLTVDDKEAFKMSIDMAEMFQDPNVPQFNWMLEGMFGTDGKMEYLYVAANKERVVYGMSNEEALKPFLKDLNASDRGLENNADVQATLLLIPQNAPWKAVVSLPGTTQFVTRFVNQFLAVLTGQEVPIPEFPACPPIGFSVEFHGDVMAADMVLPSSTLEKISEYIETCKQTF